MSTTEPVRIFVSSAPADESLRTQLGLYLRVLTRQGLVRLEAFDRAELIIPLLSADYLALGAEPGSEADRVMELAADRRGMVILPVVVRPCLWDMTPFGGYVVLPRPAQPDDQVRPVTLWANIDLALELTARAIVECLKTMRSPARQ